MKRFDCRWSPIVLSFTVLLASSFFPSSSAQAAQTFNVKTFGAKGDGVDDDTSAIKAALAAANASPGSTLLFPAGNYLYSSNLTADGISVVGQRATLTSEGSDVSLNLTGNNVSLQDMAFAIKVGISFAVHVHDASRFIVVNNTFNPNFLAGIKISKSSNGEVRSNTSNGSSTAISVNGSSQISIKKNNVTGDGSSDLCSRIGQYNDKLYRQCLFQLPHRLFGQEWQRSDADKKSVYDWLNRFSRCISGRIGECNGIKQRDTGCNFWR
jgi:parallel beta-helix repeat protein